jgi:hypothetical protein
MSIRMRHNKPARQSTFFNERFGRLQSAGPPPVWQTTERLVFLEARAAAHTRYI